MKVPEPGAVEACGVAQPFLVFVTVLEEQQEFFFVLLQLAVQRAEARRGRLRRGFRNFEQAFQGVFLRHGFPRSKVPHFVHAPPGAATTLFKPVMLSA
jgi:hypothetical protein